MATVYNYMYVAHDVQIPIKILFDNSLVVCAIYNSFKRIFCNLVFSQRSHNTMK